MDIEKIRETLETLLNNWASGALTIQDVRDMSESLEYEMRYWEPLPPTHKNSGVQEVLNQLSIAHWQLVTKDDIPVLLEMLQAKPSHVNVAWVHYRQHFNGINFNIRKSNLLKQNFYIIND